VKADEVAPPAKDDAIQFIATELKANVAFSHN
jgi:hypothetical protein